MVYYDEFDYTEWEHEFNWEDWRSNFDMSEDRWYENYDWSYLFPHEWEVAGVYYSCDDYNTCWYFDEASQMTCFLDGECYAPEEALDIYFNGGFDYEYDDDCAWTHDEREGDTSEERCLAMEGCLYDAACDHCFREGSEWQGCEWEEYPEFNYDDWRSEFDMSYDRWYEDYDWTVLFPHHYEEDGKEFYCDDWDSCWTFDEEL